MPAEAAASTPAAPGDARPAAALARPAPGPSSVAPTIEPSAAPPDADPRACLRDAGGGAVARLPAGASPRLQAMLRDCEAGKADACVTVGSILYGGRGGPSNARLAAQLWSRACDGAKLAGCAPLAEASFEGLGTKLDPACGGRVLAWACDRGDADSCEHLGARTLAGDRVAQDDARAEMLLARGCELGSWVACLRSAGAPRTDEDAGGPAELALEERAAKLAAAACDRGQSLACQALADATVPGSRPYPARRWRPPGIGVAWRANNANLLASRQWAEKACLAFDGAWSLGCSGVDPTQERALLRKACDAGNYERCIDWYFDVINSRGSGAHADSGEELAALTRACLGGVTRGCWALPSRLPQYAHVIDQACDDGEVEACHPMRLMMGGLGDAPAPWSSAQRARACSHGSAVDCEELAAAAEKAGDVAGAVGFLEKACPPFPSREDRRDIDAKACVRLAARQRTGDGVPRDAAAAAVRFRLGCFAEGRFNARGQGCRELAAMYDAGEGVAKDPVRATSLLAGLCNAQSDQCAAYGDRLWDGIGVDQDRAMARSAYATACEHGKGDACDRGSGAKPFSSW